MAAINQRIPNFIGGVSQQPDILKFPGQLRVCNNAVPDVTFGLTKRPPGEFVGKLTNANSDGYWYDIIRDGDEKFLVQISPGNTSTKPIRIWTLTDIQSSATFYENVTNYSAGDLIPAGTELTLSNGNNDALFSYLTPAPKPYSLQSIQDYTVIANPEKTVGTTGTVGGLLESGNYAYVRLDTIAYNTEYVLYTGDAPSPDTHWRVTAVKAELQTGQGGAVGSDTGSTWNDTSTAQDSLGKYAGQKMWKTTISHIIGATGSLLVNGTNYIKDHDEKTDSANDNKVSGYTPIYATQYSAQVTLKEPGEFVSEPEPGDTIGDNISIEGIHYDINVQSAESFESYSGSDGNGKAGIAFHRTPKNPDAGSLSMTSVLKGLKDSVNSSLSNVTAVVVGNGLFLTGTDAPKVNFLGGTINEGMTVISKTATDVSKLPTACRKDFVVRIDNSENEDSDNYYLKFRTDADQNTGPGSWVECARPNGLNYPGDETDGTATQTLGLNPATMPHALVNNRDGTFTFKKLDESTANSAGNDLWWKNRDVGDLITNPFPTFNGKNIQKIFFHRNRLGLIADEQVVMSRPGDYFNFFSVSAITTSDDNPIDMGVSDIKPAYINHVLPIQKGIMMMSDNGQFLLFTESDIFSPKTARLKKVSSYECDADIEPVDMGTSVMWASSVGPFTRTYEAVILDDDVPPKVIEQTRVVPEFVPNTITGATNSAALGMVTYYKKTDSNIYHYKYFDSGERRDQSAWFSWTLTGSLEHSLYTGGNFYTVTKQGSDYILSRYEYVTDSGSTRSYTLGSGTVGSPITTSRWFEACLDNMVIPSAITYTAQGASVTGPDFTDLTLGYTPTSADNFYAVALSGTDTEGNDVAGTVIKATSVGTNKATFEDVNMTGWTVAAGYRYTTIIELPNYYATSGSETSYDIDGALRISGINFEMGVSGPMEFHLSSEYADSDDYIQYESGMKLDSSDFGKPPAELIKSVRVPIQRKNEKYKLQIQIPDPFSTALISASWDGRYNTKRHVRK